MARKAKGSVKAVSVTMDKSLHATLDEARWEQRMTFSEILDDAVRVYADVKGLALVEINDDSAE